MDPEWCESTMVQLQMMLNEEIESQRVRNALINVNSRSSSGRTETSDSCLNGHASERCTGDGNCTADSGFHSDLSTTPLIDVSLRLTYNRTDLPRQFCTVSPRLHLVSRNRKISVTIGEIQRRISLPECMTFSLLVAYLRRGKNRASAAALKAELARGAFDVPEARRRPGRPNAFTPFSETEALALAADLRHALAHFYPTAPTSAYLKQSVLSAAPSIPDRRDVGPLHALKQSGAACRKYTTFIHELLNEYQTIVDEPPSKNGPFESLRVFDNLTHRFGACAFDALLEWLAQLTDRLQRQDERDCQVDASSEADVALQTPTVAQPEATFALVDARLLLVGKQKKYAVSRAEVARRLGPPEHFNATLLGGLLRRGKTLQKTAELNAEVRAIGLGFPGERRRSGQRETLFSSLLEAESAALVRDYDQLVRHHFPTSQLALLIGRRFPTDPLQLEEAAKFLTLLYHFLASDRSPMEAAAPAQCLPPAIQGPLMQFALHTHGFGIPALLSQLAALLKLLTLVRQAHDPPQVEAKTDLR